MICRKKGSSFVLSSLMNQLCRETGEAIQVNLLKLLRGENYEFTKVLPPPKFRLFVRNILSFNLRCKFH